MSEAAWEQAYADYQQIPEYQQVNAGMNLAAFKTIYWWEFIHRLWGRLIGAVFGVSMLWLAFRGRVPRPARPHLIALFVLGGLQGAIGWWMVQSAWSTASMSANTG